MDRIGGELGILVVDHRLLDTVRCSCLDHQLDFTLLVERREEVGRFIDCTTESKQSVVLQDTALVFRSKSRGDVCAFFRGQNLAGQ